MQALEFESGSFDLVLLMHALTYASKPALAIQEAARVLRRGGRLVATCLGKHEHQAAVTPYGHVNLGFTAKDLRRYADKAGLETTVCESVTREKRPPHFEVLTLLARKP
jgi:ArsR family transcriptional regulator